MNSEDEQKVAKTIARKQRDTDDFNNETAGREVGRINRFLPEGAQPRTQKAKDEKYAEQLSRLALMMQNAQYAALYAETARLVHDYAAKAEAGLESSKAALSAAGQALETITDKAAKLHPDGTPVFRDKNGNAVHADGTPLTPDETASVVWPNDAPSYEEYREAKKVYADAQARVDAWKDYQAYLGGVQDRLNDPDNPYSPDELRDIQRDIEDKIPATHQVEQQVDTVPGVEQDSQSFATGIPKVD